MADANQTLHTERLDLIPFAPEHEDGLFAMNSDPEVMRYLGGDQTREETRAGIVRVQKRWKAYGFGWWTIFLRESGDIIGAAFLQHLSHIEGAPLEIGWRLMTAHHGKGYATEAGRAAMDYGFNFIGEDKIMSVANPKNLASQQVMKRLGMTYIGLQTHYDEDCATYEIRKP